MTHNSMPSPIRDIVDFYDRWPTLRLRMETLVTAGDLTAQDRIVLDWMMRVIDRVGPADISTDDQ